MKVNWDFPYRAECGTCLDFHLALQRHLEKIEVMQKDYNSLKETAQELQQIIKNYEKKELGYDVAI